MKSLPCSCFIFAVRRFAAFTKSDLSICQKPCHHEKQLFFERLAIHVKPASRNHELIHDHAETI